MFEYITPVVDVFSMDDIELAAGLSSLVVGFSLCASNAPQNDPGKPENCNDGFSGQSTCYKGNAAPDQSCTNGNNASQIKCTSGTRK